MDRALSLSLNDIIRSRRSSGRGRVRGAAPEGRVVRGSFGSGRIGRMGALHQMNLRVNSRPSATSIAKSFRRSKNIPWQHDLIEESLAAAGITRSETDAKLFVSNLDSGVSNDDIRELFSEIGELKRYAIHFDRNGRPSGSAEVVYARRSDAFAALKRYNNVQLDGRPMKIEILSPNSEAPLTARVNVIGGMNGRTTRKVTLDPRRRGGFQNGLGRPVQRAQPGTGVVPRITSKFQGRGQGWKKRSVKSATELDKELEKYHAEAMET